MRSYGKFSITFADGGIAGHATIVHPWPRRAPTTPDAWAIQRPNNLQLATFHNAMADYTATPVDPILFHQIVLLKYFYEEGNPDIQVISYLLDTPESFRAKLDDCFNKEPFFEHPRN